VQEVRLKQTRLVGLGRDKPERAAMLVPFAEKPRSLRAAAGLSQEAIAKRCFMGGHDISDLESGYSAPGLPALLMLGDALGISVGVLTDAARRSRDNRRPLCAYRPSQAL
jgi:transcriptional regulator with XRE-family HTH domain